MPVGALPRLVRHIEQLQYPLHGGHTHVWEGAVLEESGKRPAVLGERAKGVGDGTF